MKEAVRLYRLAARKNYSRAQYLISEVYHKGKFFKKDYTQAERWYRFAQNVKYTSAYYGMALLNLDGLGVHKKRQGVIATVAAGVQPGPPHSTVRDRPHL